MDLATSVLNTTGTVVLDTTTEAVAQTAKTTAMSTVRQAFADHPIVATAVIVTASAGIGYGVFKWLKNRRVDKNPFTVIADAQNPTAEVTTQPQVTEQAK